ncbi:PAS domain-containing protein [Ideonella sp. BN130291]|uniref:PAS domain-containing protein n=1 Tax=Ideonella sp. BN130291 TaxID=3112940 RepID=UPI002E2668B8|nr:PAS domain-containing protein [Ideonella sp. BN130291]
MSLPGPLHLLSEAPAAALAPHALQALALHSPSGLAWLDADGRVRWANPAFQRITGQAAPVGRRIDTLLPGADEAGAPAPWLARALAGEPLAEPVELACRQADGTALWLCVGLAAITPSQADAGFVATLTDRTREHQEQQERQRLAELLDMAQEFGRIGVWERDIRTLQGRWDRHVFRFWGLKPGEATPHFDEAAKSVHPEDNAASVVRASLERAGTYSHRFRVRGADGVVRLLHSQWVVNNGSDGRPERAIGIMMDDTEVYELARAASDAHEQLNMAVDLANIAIWRHDLRTNRMHYNARAWEVLDLQPRPEGLTLDEVRALIHPEDLPQVIASAERSLATDQPTDMEARYKRADGSWRYVLNRRVVQRDVTGTPVAFVGVALDVTEQVEGSRKAYELSRRLETAARAAHIGLWTVEVATGALEWNTRTSQLFGLAPEQSPRSFDEWMERCVHPEDRPRVRELAFGWIKTGDDLLQVEYRTVWPDGTVRWLVNRSDVDRVSQGRYVFGVTLDVTEQRATIDALREASERSALIARSIGMGTWEVDLRDGKAYWNEQMFALRGLRPGPEPLPAAERLALTHPDDRHLVINALDEALASNRPATYEFRVRQPDGSYRWLASRSTTVMDEQGRPLRRIGVNWDITDSKNAEAARHEKTLALRESEAKSQFLARMSHELRTPLNAVLGFTQLLLAEAERVDPIVLRLRLGHIRSAGQHLLSLINDVLELSSLDSGELRMALEPVPLAQLVASTLPLVERMAHEYGVRLHCEPLPGHALADTMRLRQVLLNLLSNGIKYNRPGGHVSVACGNDAPDGMVSLQVKDNGRGMSAEQLLHVFEPFNRLGVEREGIEGTGIGLTIVKALVERMGGRVEVRSEPGAGTEFRVLLPRADMDGRARPAAIEPPPAATEPPQPPATQRPPRSGRLLYIEDNPVNVLLVSELVALRPGLRLDVAADGESGLRLAADIRPDLILVDMQLPDIDGHQVRNRLRVDPRTAHIPCIALSANAMPQDIERALKNGFADYWTKPLDFKAFLAAIDALFSAG